MQLDAGKAWLLFEPGKRVRFSRVSGAPFQRQLNDKATWYLADGCKPTLELARTFVAVSPAKALYYEYSKNPGTPLHCAGALKCCAQLRSACSPWVLSDDDALATLHLCVFRVRSALSKAVGVL